MTPGLTLALSLALLAGKHWQLDIRSIECRAPQVAVGARIRYVGPKGAVEAPLSRLVDAEGRRYPARSLVWRGGSKELAQWLPSGGLHNVQAQAAADVELRFDVQGARGALKLEFGDIAAIALTRGSACLAPGALKAPQRPRAAPVREFRIYRGAYPCRAASGSLRRIEADHPPHLPRQLLVFGHGFLPNAREVALPAGTAPAQSYAYAGVDSLDAVDAAARRALAADFPQYVIGRRHFAFNWGVQRSQSGNETYAVGIYDLRDC